MYAGLHVDIHLADHMVDLVADGIDMAIRITRLKDSSLIARKLADYTGHVVAAPSYLEQYGEPNTPPDLAQHKTLAYTNITSPNIWDFEGPEGPVTVRVNPVMSCNNGEFTSIAAIRGIGIAREPEFIVAEALSEGRLVRILKDYDPMNNGGIYAVYPERRHLPSKVRVFIDFLVEKFRGGLCNFHAEACKEYKEGRGRQRPTP